MDEGLEGGFEAYDALAVVTRFRQLRTCCKTRYLCSAYASLVSHSFLRKDYATWTTEWTMVKGKDNSHDSEQ
jgi:hypothetical protein